MARLFLLSVVALLLQSCLGFNIEVRQVVRKVGPAGSYFGTSVSFHSSAAPVSSTNDFILAGAPLANRSAPATASTIEPNFQQNQPGALYSCNDLGASGQNSATDCGEVNQDKDIGSWWPQTVARTPYNLATSVYTGPLYFRGQGRFGYNTVSSGPGGTIRTCAPSSRSMRPVYGSGNEIITVVHRPGGYCVDTAADLGSIQLLKFCTASDFGVQFVSNAVVGCNVGLSSTFMKTTNVNAYADTFVTVVGQGPNINNGHYLRAGVPGTAETADFAFSAGLRVSVRGGGYASASAIGQHRVARTGLSPALLRTIFFGSPRGRSLLSQPYFGYVKGTLLFILDTSATAVNYNIMFVGTQESAGFGFSLVTGEFDEVEGSDIAIGAPFHTNYDQPRNFENGIVAYWSGGFITEQWPSQAIPDNTMTNASQYDVPEQLFMGANRAQLGYALANIGDTNRDGFDELVVGAPGINTVYIYYGRPGGLRAENRQTIGAADVQQGAYRNSLDRFGASLSTKQFHADAWDMDNNGYADLLVGAPGSDSAVYLKARPVVHIQATFAFTPTIIDFERCLNSRNSFCFSVRVCFNINGTQSAGVLVSDNVMALLSVCEGTADNQCATTRRLADRTWLNSQGNAVLDPTVERAVPHNAPGVCFDFNATLVTTINDKLAPVRILASWTVVDKSPTDVDSLTPIGTRYGRQNALGQLNVQKDCLSITCYPDMYIRSANLTRNGTSVPSITLGVDLTLTISVEVGNMAEPATTPTVTIALPVGTTLASAAAGSSCTAAAASGSSSVVTCVLGNPFERNQTARVSINVAVSQPDFDPSTLDLRFLVQVSPDQLSTPENVSVLGDNSRNLTVPVLRRAGFSQTGTIDQGASITLTSGGTVANVTRDSDFGPVVSVRYSLVTPASGSALPDSLVRFEYPEQLKGSVTGVSRFILYLTEVRALAQDISCNLRGLVNPLNVITPTPVDAPAQDDSLITIQNCDNAAVPYCTRRFQCRFGRINPSGAKTILLTFRVANATFVQQDLVPQQLTTSYLVESISMPAGFTLLGTVGNTLSLTVDVQNLVTPTSESANIGIIIGSAVGGLALIVIIIVVLWKVGFFKRAKIDDMDGGGAGGNNDAPVTYNKDQEKVEGIHSDV